MQKRWLPVTILAAYAAFLIWLMVFKTAEFQIGSMRFRFPPHVGEPNFVPLKTIWPYLNGDANGLISTLNLVGNIVLLVPVGFLASFIHRQMNWAKCLILAVAAGLTIEGLEVALHVGIFDIDDLILNGLGVILGYLACRGFVRPKGS